MAKKNTGKPDGEEKEKLPPVQIEETEDLPADEPEEEDEVDPSQTEVDFEAIAVAESERADKAEKALAGKAFKERKEHREGGDDEGDDLPSEPLTEERLRAILAEDRQRNLRDSQSGSIADIVSKLASSEAEARAIIATHKNRQFPADLSLQDQLEEAQAIVNRKRTAAREGELKRALKGKENAGHDSAGSHFDGTGGGGATPPKIAATTATVLAKGGFKWDATRKLYAKKLPNGKTLFANPKAPTGTRKQWIE